MTTEGTCPPGPPGVLTLAMAPDPVPGVLGTVSTDEKAAIVRRLDAEPFRYGDDLAEWGTRCDRWPWRRCRPGLRRPRDARREPGLRRTSRALDLATGVTL